MVRFIVRRLLLLVPILFGVSVLIFFWVRALPGSSVEALLGERATARDVVEYKKRYGLDKPVYEQYYKYLGQLARGDLGVSIATRRLVTTEIKERFPATVELAIAAMIFAIGLGVPLGFFAAKKHGGLFDHVSLVVTLLGISIPIFFLAIILKYVFAVRLGWLPTVGRVSVTTNVEERTHFYTIDTLLAGDWSAFWDVIKHLILPAIALGSIPLAIITRITRAATLDVQ